MYWVALSRIIIIWFRWPTVEFLTRYLNSNWEVYPSEVSCGRFILEGLAFRGFPWEVYSGRFTLEHFTLGRFTLGRITLERFALGRFNLGGLLYPWEFYSWEGQKFLFNVALGQEMAMEKLSKVRQTSRNCILSRGNWCLDEQPGDFEFVTALIYLYQRLKDKFQVTLILAFVPNILQENIRVTSAF